ncbi:ABC transporter ATP-binding protein [Cytobacillus gottheilii]|uniref:ABC transporter ATP-binding protein n=1 Tax=Cytobacillus gottheilii TaxID=859144 RepID=A0ABX8FGA2_9BACI|nr:ABC transporter ATP-binding protein [Cytobacillus gottheilii]QVY63027.1 ABC transporter ATP-binding protein [Cytobacillus gottheilii]
METIITLNGVTKKFKEMKAVDDVTLTIQKGEIVAILGPNGAGKTTTIMMMLGLLQPSSGTVTLFGSPPKEKKVRERIGTMLQEVSVIDALTVREILQLFRSYYPKSLSIHELVTLTGLNEEDMKKRADKLSGGQKRRLSFALALAGDPDLLFFDEPTVGMDISSRRKFWNTVKELQNKGKTVVFTTHYLQEADDAADRIILFQKGKVIADGTPAQIKSKLSRQSVSFVPGQNALSYEELRSIPAVTEVYQKGDRCYLVSENSDIVVAEIFNRKLDVKDILVESGRLDEAFEQLTAQEGADVIENVNNAV